MSGVRWTEEQSKAIYTRNCNLLVAAAAGSGKTAVLVQRIIEMITHKENPIDIDRLLIVTFTNAAASEMRERIGNAISNEIGKLQQENDYGASKNLQRQLALLTRASITTIHSFCLNLIKNNFHMLDLDPGFRVCDPTEIELIKSEVIEGVFEERYFNIEEGTDEEFKLLVDAYGSNRDDSSLKQLILKTFSKIMSLPEPFEWLREKCEEFNLNGKKSIEGSYWEKTLIEDTKDELQGVILQYEEILDIVSRNEELEPYLEGINKEREAINLAYDRLSGGITEFCQGILLVEFGRLKSIRNVKNKAGKDRVADVRKNIKKKVDAIKERFTVYCSEEAMDDVQHMYKMMDALREIIVQFNEEFKLEKKRRGIIDFNDFEHLALQLLVKKGEGGEIFKENNWYVPSDTASEVMEKFDEILVDEYQDSNMVQEVILNMISKENIGEPNIFMVGDVKQSIYKFRQANPKLFMDKYERYKEDGLYRKIMLFKNFRSRCNVVDGVNYIFEAIMSEKAGELLYDERERLNFGASFGDESKVEGTFGGDIELHMIELEDEDDKQGEENEELSKVELEGRFIADKIRSMIRDENFFVFDKRTGEYRNLQYRDIVILLRSTSSTAEVMVEEMKKRSIPVYADVGSGYFETTEVKTVLSLLRIIDNPLQDIHLLAVMRSPIGGFYPEEFVKIRKANPEDSFFNACEKYVQSISSSEDRIDFDKDLITKISKFLSDLECWRGKSTYMTLDQFIWMLMTTTGYFGFVGSMSSGIQRQGNLKILYQRAKAFENTSYKGLFNFVNFIEKLRKSSGDMGAAKTIGESEDVVRIMSIHKSKGLEFPVVFLSMLNKQFNLQDLNENVLFHDELGFGPDYVNINQRISYPTIFKEIIKSKMKKETLSEEMRILYVALTRAREKLILTSGVKNIEKYIQSVSKNIILQNNKLISSVVLGCKSYLDWITSALLLHKNGVMLREKCDFIYDESSQRFNHPSKWKINFHFSRDIMGLVEEIEEDSQESLSERIFRKIKSNAGEKYGESVDKRLGYEYEYKELAVIPTVMTVTQLKNRSIEELEFGNEASGVKEKRNIKLKKRPVFMEKQQGLTAAEKGTAVHNAMQYMVLNEIDSLEKINQQLEKLADEKYMTREEVDVIDPNMILRFGESKLGKRTIIAYENGKLIREKQFGINMPATEVFKELREIDNHGELQEKKIKVQGIIDMFIEEEDGIILVDFKTDYVKDKHGINEIKERYKEQLDQYSKAISRITCKKVKEKHLYLFNINQSVLIDEF